jgi:hypothetical protein
VVALIGVGSLEKLGVHGLWTQFLPCIKLAGFDRNALGGERQWVEKPLGTLT